jgi:hypothetical protein
MPKKDWQRKVGEMKEMYAHPNTDPNVKKKVKEWANYFDPLVATALGEDEVCDNGSTIPE